MSQPAALLLFAFVLAACGGDDSTGTGGTGGSTTDGGDASSNCGSVQCPAGKICCNPVMSICADPGGVCAQ